MLILWVCVAIAMVVFGVMIYSIVKFRKSQGAVPDTHDAPQHEGRDHLDDHPGGHPRGDGRAGRASTLIKIEDTATPRSPSR
jgi:hypothetical protein